MYYDKRTEVEPAPVKHREYTAMQQSCLEAAEYIRTHGWCQGTYQNQTGRVCMVWALQVIELTTSIPNRGYFHPAKRGFFHLAKLVGDPIRWNDAPFRTVEEVIAALEAAAEMEE